MQKDTVVHTISSVMLDETNRNIPIVIQDIQSTAVNGVDLGLGGYLDIGLYDTMEDLFVSFVGAVTFSVIGYFYLKKHGQGTFVRNSFPPSERMTPQTMKKKLTLPKLGTVSDYRHLWMLSFWILYLILYVVVEHAVTTDYWVSYLPLDDKIPFCEYFIIPYCMWHRCCF